MLDRVTPSILFPTLDVRSFKYLVAKLVGATVSVSVFLVTIGLVLRWLFREHRDASWILLGSAVGSVAMYVVLEIVGPSAEYKYLLVSALFFAPLSALAIQRLFSRNARLLVPLSVIGSLVLVLPALHKVYTDFPWIPPWRLPAVEDGGYELRLKSEEEYSKVVEVIRESTPSNSVVVVERCDIYLPALTHRKLYAPPLQERPHPGIFLMSSLLLEQQKGYGKGIVDARRTTVRELFNSNDGAQIEQAVDEISSLRRPVAVVLRIPQNRSLQDWLRISGRASKLFGDENKEVWLIGAS
jgi:hypothetical protein